MNPNMSTKNDDTISPLATPSLTKRILSNIKEYRERNIKKGANEVTKMINRGKAMLVVLAADCNPIEIIQHIPVLCNDKDVSYIYIESGEALGRACGVERGIAAATFYYDSDEAYDRMRVNVGGIINDIRT